MGTCYSKTGHDVPSDREKRPREKKRDSYKNGHTNKLKHNQLVIDFPIQKDLSDTVYTEDSHVVQTDGENCINKSQQTSLDHLSKDANKNNEIGCSFETIEANECVVINCKNLENSKCGLDTDNKSRTEISKCLSPLDGKVSISDSGIVVESFKGCDNTEKSNYVCDGYSQDFEARVDSLAEDTNTAELNDEKKIELPFCEKCSCRLSDSKHCDLLGNRPLTDHSNICRCHGECQGHLFSERSRPIHVNASSESLILKSSLKKGNSRSRRKKGLSWKSADSLDYLESMAISLDRTKSVCSSILGDDISLLNAPLAAFESVDFALGSSYDFSKRLGESMKNRVDYCSDTFQFQFDFSGLEGEHRQSLASIDRLSESNKRTESTTDLDKIRLAIRQTNVGTASENR